MTKVRSLLCSIIALVIMWGNTIPVLAASYVGGNVDYYNNGNKANYGAYYDFHSETNTAEGIGKYSSTWQSNLGGCTHYEYISGEAVYGVKARLLTLGSNLFEWSNDAYGNLYDYWYANGYSTDVFTEMYTVARAVKGPVATVQAFETNVKLTKAERIEYGYYAVTYTPNSLTVYLAVKDDGVQDPTLNYTNKSIVSIDMYDLVAYSYQGNGNNTAAGTNLVWLSGGEYENMWGSNGWANEPSSLIYCYPNSSNAKYYNDIYNNARARRGGLPDSTSTQSGYAMPLWWVKVLSDQWREGVGTNTSAENRRLAVLSTNARYHYRVAGIHGGDASFSLESLNSTESDLIGWFYSAFTYRVITNETGKYTDITNNGRFYRNSEKWSMAYTGSNTTTRPIEVLLNGPEFELGLCLPQGGVLEEKWTMPGFVGKLVPRGNTEERSFSELYQGKAGWHACHVYNIANANSTNYSNGIWYSDNITFAKAGSTGGASSALCFYYSNYNVLPFNKMPGYSHLVATGAQGVTTEVNIGLNSSLGLDLESRTLMFNPNTWSWEGLGYYNNTNLSLNNISANRGTSFKQTSVNQSVYDTLSSPLDNTNMLPYAYEVVYKWKCLGHENPLQYRLVYKTNEGNANGSTSVHIGNTYSYPSNLISSTQTNLTSVGPLWDGSSNIGASPDKNFTTAKPGYRFDGWLINGSGSSGYAPVKGGQNWTYAPATWLKVPASNKSNFLVGNKPSPYDYVFWARYVGNTYYIDYQKGLTNN